MCAWVTAARCVFAGGNSSCSPFAPGIDLGIAEPRTNEVQELHYGTQSSAEPLPAPWRGLSSARSPQSSARATTVGPQRAAGCGHQRCFAACPGRRRRFLRTREPRGDVEAANVGVWEVRGHLVASVSPTNPAQLAISRTARRAAG